MQHTYLVGPLARCQSSPTSANRQRRDTAHAPELTTPPPCSSASPGHRFDAANASPVSPRSIRHLTPPPNALPSSVLSATERVRRRRRASSWPQPLPRLVVSPRGSASTPSSSPPTHAPPDALHRRRRRLPHLRPPRIFAVDSPPSSLPRARFYGPCNRCEATTLFPLTPCSIASPNRLTTLPSAPRRRPWHRRGHRCLSSRLSTPSGSRCSQEPKTPIGSSVAAP